MAKDRSLAPLSEFKFPRTEVGRRLAAVDWSATPVGTPDQWPLSLKTVVRIMLTSRFAMWMAWGPNLTFFCNDAYLPTVGIKRDWVLGAKSTTVWAEIWPDIGPRIAHVLTTGEATWDEALMLYLERAGFTEETFHTFSYSPLADDDGTTAGMLCVVAEVTDEVIGERQLALLRDLGSRLAGASTRDAVMDALVKSLEAATNDVPFSLVYFVNDEERAASLAASHGLPPASPLSPKTALLDDEHAIWPLDGMESVSIGLATEHLADFKLRHWQQPPDTAVIVPLAAAEHSHPIGYLVAGINPHRKLDAGYQGFIDLLVGQVAAALARADEYERARKRAEALAEIDQAKTAFFSNVSHEFRTPLTLMLGPIEDAQHLANAPVQRELLDIAHRNAMRLLRLVNALLDFSRIEAGRMEAVYRATDLADLVTDLASSFRAATDKAGLRLIVDTAPLSKPAFVDRDMWEKIVLNLMSNAFKFTEQGEIRVELREDHGQAVLAISDTGTGIPADELPKLFDRFHRVEGAKGRSFEGSGIGLSLVRELVALHGGTITVDSVEGEGSTFTITMPLGDGHLPRERVRRDDNAAFQPTQAAAFVQEALRWLPGDATAELLVAEDDAEAASGPQGQGSTVLLVDDNADLRGYIAKLLRDAGYQVDTAPNGQEALARLDHAKPDLIVTDVMMPVLDGLGLLRQIRSRRATQDIPVIMLSARAGEEASAEGLQAGANDYLTKPFSARELLARVAANINLAHVRKQAEQARSENERKLRELNETLQQRVTEALSEKRLFSEIIEATDISVQVVDDQYRVRAINSAAQRDYCRVFGVVPEVGESVLALLSHLPEERDAAQRIWARALGGERFSEVNWWGSDAHERRAYETTFSPLIDSDGQQVGAYVLGYDVTDRLREQERLALAEEQLRQAQKMEAMGQLTGGVAHDFNNLLTPIMGALDMLQRNGLGSEREQRLIAGAMKSADRAKTLVQRLLAFARRQPLQATAVDLGALVRGMQELIASTTGPQIKIEIDVADDVGAANADANQVEMALLNLSVNARDAMPNGGTLRITVAEFTVDQEHRANLSPGRYVCLAVSDTGVGMAEEVRARAVEPFFSTKGIGKGTGLGLSMVHGLTSQLGGGMAIQSQVDKGTTIELWLPAAEARVPTAPDRSLDVAPNRASGTVLLVDDEELVRASTADMLNGLGFTVVEAASAEEALAMIDKGLTADLLITDHLMSGMSGIDLARKLRVERPEINVLLVSGYAEANGIAPDLPRLIKPFRQEELASELAKIAR